MENIKIAKSYNKTTISSIIKLVDLFMCKFETGSILVALQKKNGDFYYEFITNENIHKFGKQITHTPILIINDTVPVNILKAIILEVIENNLVSSEIKYVSILRNTDQNSIEIYTPEFHLV